MFSKEIKTINIVHWNIKELDNQKLKDPSKIRNIKSVLSNLEYNILSVNELQYDLDGVPNYKYKTIGKNAETLAKELGSDVGSMAISFTQANTGQNAKKEKGNYLTKNTIHARKLADPINYGLFPGQFSTALLSYYPIKEEIVIKDLKWNEFNKDINYNKYKDNNRKPFKRNPELFDKSFTDNIIEVEGKEVHIISLHAVPSYHFGNKWSANYDRNRDQLRFLEWYITGGTDLSVKLPKRFKHIKPLKKNSRYIIMGDFNVSIYSDNPGSKILKRIFQTTKMWLQSPSHTHEIQRFEDKRNPLLLDYIGYKGLTLIDSGIYYPKENDGSCLSFSELPKQLKPRSNFTKKDCYNEDLVELKLASDHFPIWAKLKLD